MVWVAHLCGWKLSAAVRKGPSPTGWSSRRRITQALYGDLSRDHRCPGVLGIWFCDMEHQCYPRLEGLMVTVRLPVPSRTSSLFPPDRERFRVPPSVTQLLPQTSSELSPSALIPPQVQVQQGTRSVLERPGLLISKAHGHTRGAWGKPGNLGSVGGEHTPRGQTTVAFLRAQRVMGFVMLRLSPCTAGYGVRDAGTNVFP